MASPTRSLLPAISEILGLVGGLDRRKAAAVGYRHAYGWMAGQGLHFCNHGYWPVSDEIAAIPFWAAEGTQCELYRQALLSLPPGRTESAAALLDIGCGLGGGLSYLAWRLPSTFTCGVDIAVSGLEAARGIVGSALFAADATRLPFYPGYFDIVVNVETSHLHSGDAFFAEVARVTRPGGAFVLVDQRKQTAADARSGFGAYFRRNGFRLTEFRDISSNVSQACRADTERRQRLVEQLPWIFRSRAREMLAVAGSRREQEISAGERACFIVAGQRMA